MRLRDTAERPYFLRKVIRNPNPRKIITCTSWNTEKKKLLIHAITFIGKILILFIIFYQKHNIIGWSSGEL